MTNARKKLGAMGERMAVSELKLHGYNIRHQNWRARPSEHGFSGEIDIVAELPARLGHRLQLAFVEVKTRRGGFPELQLTDRKAKQLMQLALVYLEAHGFGDQIAFTIDLMAIELDSVGRLVRVEHIKNVAVQW